MSFGTDSPCDVEIVNQAFIDAVQYINPVIADRSKKYNSLYRSMIDRGTFNYGEGYIKKSETFYGGTAVQDSGSSWSAVEASRAPGTNGQDDPGHDACRYESEVIGYGFEEKSYTLYEATRRTLDICLTDILFKWKYEKQLAMIYGSLANVTLGEWEQIEREFYIDFCTKYIASPDTSGIGLDTFTMAIGAGQIAIPAGGLDAIGRLTQSLLDRFYSYLYRQSQSGMVGMKDGMPQFALITSPETSTELIRLESARSVDMRYQDPSFLIEGYGTVKAYQGYAHIHDPHAPRFQVNAVGTFLERVYPYTATATTIGDAVNVDTEYVLAPFELAVVFLKNVYNALVPPANPAKLANGYTFDPADNFGTFNWFNIQDRCENILNEKGFFFGRYRIAPEPLENSGDAVCVLHRRCNAISLQYCYASDGATSATVVTSCAQKNSTDALADATEYIVLLADDLGCQVGQQVTVTFVGTATANAIIQDDKDAPYYTIAFAAGVAGGWCAYDTGMATGTVICS